MLTMSSELDLLIEVLAKPYKYLGNLLPGDGTRTLAFQPDGREPFKVLTKIRDNGKSFAIHFDDDAGSAEVTGKGDAFRILSTVIQIAKDYVKKVKTIEEIWIISKYEEGGKNSRAKLYKALIDKFAENEGFKLDKTEMHTSKGIEYMTYILKKNAVEEEVATYKAFTNAVRTDETPNKDGYIETTASSDKEAVKNLKYKIAGLITTIQSERLNGRDKPSNLIFQILDSFLIGRCCSLDITVFVGSLISADRISKRFIRGYFFLHGILLQNVSHILYPLTGMHFSF